MEDRVPLLDDIAREILTEELGQLIDDVFDDFDTSRWQQRRVGRAPLKTTGHRQRNLPRIKDFDIDLKT